MKDANGEAKFKRDIAFLRELIDVHNEAALVCIDGFVGGGKTTLAVLMAEEYQNKPLDYNTQYANGAEDFINKIVQAKLQNKKVIVFDEGSDFGSRSAMSSLNKRVNEVFNQYRAFKMLVIICLPSISFIDKQIFRKGVFRMLYHIGKKVEGKYAVAECFSAVQTEFILWKMSKYKANLELAYTQQRSCYKYRFPPLPPRRDNQLKDLTTDKKVKRLKDLTKYVTRKDILKETGLSHMSVYKRMKKLKIKPVDTKGQSYYFERDVIEKIKSIKNPK